MTRWLLGALLLGGALWCLWSLRPPDAAAAGNGPASLPRADGSVAVAGEPAWSTGGDFAQRASLEDGDAARPGAAGPSRVTITVRLQDGEQQPLPGTVAYVTGAAAESMPAFGEKTQPWRQQIATGVQAHESLLAPDGVVALTVPRGERLWLRASAARDPAACRYRRIDSAREDQDLVFEFAATEGRRVHVFVLDAGLDAPARQCAVELCRHGEAGPSWRGATDGNGYLVATAPDQATIQVRVAGASPADVDAVQVRHLDRERGEPVVILAAPEAEVPCTFRVESSIRMPTGAAPPAVILVRAGGGRQQVRLLSPALPEGTTEHRIELPLGEYAVLPLPQGCGRIASGTDLVRVTDPGQTFSIALTAGTRRIVELAGIPDTDMPIQVRTERADDLFAVAEDRIWLGPTRWRRRREAVGDWSDPAHLVAWGRSTVWVAAGEVAATATGSDAITVVPMVRGAAIEVLARSCSTVGARWWSRRVRERPRRRG